MFEVTKYPHGTFSWPEALTTDQAAGTAFYNRLLGWESEDVPTGMGDMTYTLFSLDGKSVAGLSPQTQEQREQGMPSVWNSYITVDDVDATAAQVEPLGGTLVAPPFDVLTMGRMAILQDPTGAFVMLWQPTGHIGSSWVNRPGAMTWNELQSTDASAAADFYSSLLGWEYDMNEEMGYRTIMNNGRPNGGIMQMSEEFGGMPSHWMVYFSVADIHAAVEKVKELGGNVIVGVIPAGDTGDFAIITDPQGAAVALIQTKAPQPWDA